MAKIGFTSMPKVRFVQLGRPRVVLLEMVPHVKASVIESMIKWKLGDALVHEWFVWSRRLFRVVVETIEEARRMPDLQTSLRKKRLERNLTQEEASKAIGISQEMLAQIESGARHASTATTNKISRWMSAPSATPKSVKGPYNQDRTTIPVKK